jgi:hypothetical protein
MIVSYHRDTVKREKGVEISNANEMVNVDNHSHSVTILTLS